jgi:flagellar hook-basal body complex protein FliE
MNTIQPIQAINSLGALNKAQAVQGASSPEIPFCSLVKDAVSNAEQTNSSLNGEIYKLTTGQSDDLHNAIIASQKANLSVDMVIELRNKLLEAYNQVMNISV